MCVFITAWHLRRMEPIRFLMNACGMLFHSCIRARRSSSKVSGGFNPFRTRRPSLSHKCSMGFKSGDNAGHGRLQIWLSFRKSIDTRATWHRTLSCWKTWLKRFILQSDHLLYKYAIRINFCFIRTRRINFSVYESTFQPTNKLSW